MALRVLVVEDNPLNQELVRDLLEAAGHRVEVAGDGAQLRRLAAAGAPDIVLMDILLGSESGVTLLADLRSRPAFERVPVLAVTAQALAGDREHFLAAGFDAVVTKPIDTRTFVADVEQHAARRAGVAEGNGNHTHRR
jgi:CheY-like chemotaxis protein